MTGRAHGSSESFEAKHAEIIARTLRWADEAAARRDYVEALRWVEKVRSLGQTLPDAYEAKRQAWLQTVDRAAMTSTRAASHHMRRRASG
jgi:hypothetical protein